MTVLVPTLGFVRMIVIPSCWMGNYSLPWRVELEREDFQEFLESIRPERANGRSFTPIVIKGNCLFDVVSLRDGVLNPQPTIAGRSKNKARKEVKWKWDRDQWDY